MSVGDAQRLPAEWTGRFARVIASLCIHIVPDPDAALREFYRVIPAATGGAVGATGWGRRADSPLFLLLEETLAALRSDGTLPPAAPAAAPPARSNFHLGQVGRAGRCSSARTDRAT